VLKAECKSRSTFGASTVKEAIEALEAHEGLPNPSTLAFITKRLYEDNRDEEARVFQELQCQGELTPKHITHGIFALAGNDPCDALRQAPKPKRAAIKRENAAVMVTDHSDFITTVFTKYGT